MTDLIAYRGPDSEGFLLAQPNGRSHFHRVGDSLQQHTDFVPKVGLGHRRLSILDLSEAGCQPMSYADGKYWIVYNGEVYNYVELRQELERMGYAFRSHTDTEVILAAYAAWGCDCMQKFNGMWSFAILDLAQGRIVCSRDRMGIKPFYYRWSDGILSFGSEIKQLLLTGPTKAHRESLFDFLVMRGHTDHRDSTCFEGVVPLLGGQYMTLKLDNGTPQIHTYYTTTFDPSRDPGSFSAVVERVRDLLADSVRLRLRSDVPVGSCLSGGLDSSCIVSLMSRLRDRSNPQTGQHTFTFVSTEKQYDESYYADLVVASTGVTPHIIAPASEEVRADLLKHIWHLDEPSVSMSTLAQWFVFKQARASGIPVMLDGQGGDELFLGYEYFHTVPLRHKLKRLWLLSALQDIRLTAWRSNINPLWQMFQLLYHQSDSLRSLALWSKGDKWLNKDFLKSNNIRQRLKHLGLHYESPTMEVRAVTHMFHLLRYEDRNSMAFSIEARLPMLDYRLVDLAVSLHLEYKIREGWSKLALRKASESFLPNQISWRTNKFGFNAPQKHWMEIISEEVRKTLTGPELAASRYLNPVKIRAMLDDPQTPPNIIWQAFNLEQWFRIFNVQS